MFRARDRESVDCYQCQLIVIMGIIFLEPHFHWVSLQ